MSPAQCVYPLTCSRSCLCARGVCFSRAFGPFAKHSFRCRVRARMRSAAGTPLTARLGDRVPFTWICRADIRYGVYTGTGPSVIFERLRRVVLTVLLPPNAVSTDNTYRQAAANSVVFFFRLKAKLCNTVYFGRAHVHHDERRSGSQTVPPDRGAKLTIYNTHHSFLDGFRWVQYPIFLGDNPPEITTTF